MKKPKKKDVSENALGHILYNRGYNHACDDWEKFLLMETLGVITKPKKEIKR